MKNKIYRSVSVEERFPNGTGTGDYTVVFKDGSMSSDTDAYCDGVVAWLEEIELPSEEDLSYDMGMPPRKGSDLWWHYQGFKNGANFIINHIKGGEK